MVITVKACCCINLRTAGMAIGWLYVLGLVITISTIIFDTTKNGNYLDTMTPITYHFVDTKHLPTLLVYLAFSGLLIYGIKSNNHNFLLPWLIFEGIQLVVLVIAEFVLVINEITLMDVIVALMIGLSCWAWIVVYSLYKEIRMPPIEPIPLLEISTPLS